MTPPRTIGRRALTVATALLPFAIAGCQTAMSTPLPNPAAASAGSSVKPNEFPLRFKGHSFESHCYNTIGCTVFYYDTFESRDKPDEVSPPPIADYQKNWMASHVGIPNFPEPAIVKWRSLDGKPHEASVDIGAIFKDELVLHDVPEDEIPEGWAHDIRPDIFLEVNDRTVNVYMQSFVATKDEQIPGNKYSHNKRKLTKAWSKSY